MRNVLLGVFCDAIISRSYNVNGVNGLLTVDMVMEPMVVSARPNDKIPPDQLVCYVVPDIIK